MGYAIAFRDRSASTFDGQSVGSAKGYTQFGDNGETLLAVHERDDQTNMHALCSRLTCGTSLLSQRNLKL